MQITISQLKKAFNDNMAVNIDSLHVNDGEIIGLVGNNGAGKTTMFRLMLDLLKADNGYVDLTFCTNANEQTQGTGDAADTITVDPAKMEDWKRYTGAYIDDSFLIDFLLPEEYFEFIAKVCGRSEEHTGLSGIWCRVIAIYVLWIYQGDSDFSGRSSNDRWLYTGSDLF